MSECRKTGQSGLGETFPAARLLFCYSSVLYRCRYKIAQYHLDAVKMNITDRYAGCQEKSFSINTLQHVPPVPVQFPTQCFARFKHVRCQAVNQFPSNKPRLSHCSANPTGLLVCPPTLSVRERPEPGAVDAGITTFT